MAMLKAQMSQSQVPSIFTVYSVRDHFDDKSLCESIYCITRHKGVGMRVRGVVFGSETDFICRKSQNSRLLFSIYLNLLSL
jgi:hypothetical protein